MKRVLLSLLVLAWSFSPAFAVSTCADFSGSWTGTCSGFGIESPLTMSFQQTACSKLTPVGESTTTGLTDILLDGQSHAADAGTKYQATWATDGNQLTLDLTSSVESVDAKISYTFSQAADKTQSVKIQMLRSIPSLGSAPEVFETCEGKKSAN